MDYSIISFPNLGIQINPDRFLAIGDLTVYFYGMIIALGLVLAISYGLVRCRQFGIQQEPLMDGVLLVVPIAVLCARLYYCIFEWEQYADEPLSIFYIWEGGLAIYGGVIGAALGVILFCAIKRIKLPALLDLVALGFLIGQSVGRWGNFFNREAFGSTTDWFLKMGLFNTRTGMVEYHHPTFLYESVWNLAGFVLLHFLSKKRKYDGQIALGYVAWYGLGRAFIEGLRTDSLYLGPFRVSQLLAAVSCVAAVAVLVVMAFRRHDPEKLYVNQIAAQEAAKAEETEEKSAPEEAAEAEEGKNEE